MSISRRLGQRWTDEELIVVLDLRLNHGLNDGHNHDAIAKCLGRYSPVTNSWKDGPVNQKLSEIIGMLNQSRAKRHSGNKIEALLKRYEKNLPALRREAKKSWPNILRTHSGSVPKDVQRLL